MPEGTSLAATDRVVGEMEKAAEADPAIEYYYSTVGSRLVAGGLSLNTKAEYLGQLNIVMKDRTDELAGGRDIGKAPRAVREHPRSRGEIRTAVVLQPEDPGRGRALRREPRGPAELLARSRRRDERDPGPRGRPLLARGGEPRAPGRLRPGAARQPRPRHGRPLGDAAEPRAGRRAHAVQGRRPADRRPHPQPGGEPRIARRRAQPRAPRAERRADPAPLRRRCPSRPRSRGDPPPAAAESRRHHGELEGKKPRPRDPRHRGRDPAHASARRRHDRARRAEPRDAEILREPPVRDGARHLPRLSRHGGDLRVVHPSLHRALHHPARRRGCRGGASRHGDRRSP